MKPPYFWKAGLDPWSRDAAPLTRQILTPAAWLYAALTARRIRQTVPRKVSAFVMCIGNVTAGGTGKSPIVQALRSNLTNETGLRVASLSRGYGGMLKGPLRVDETEHDASAVGDEPLMLSLSGESWIGRDRAQAGADMSSQGVDIIIMDDGHQNPTLSKDLSIVVIDAEAGFGNGFVIPKGPLREPAPIGLQRADLIIAMGDGDLPAFVAESGTPIFRADLIPDASPPPGPYVAFAGIGRPEKFFLSLESLNCDVRDTVPFDDHHPYRADDLAYLRRLADDHGAKLITTEKDYARLPLAQRGGVMTLPVTVEFDDASGLMQFLLTALERHDPHGQSQ